MSVPLVLRMPLLAVARQLGGGLAALAVLIAAASGVQESAGLAEAVRELDGASPARATAVVDRLSALGPSAARAALDVPPEQWRQLGLTARRARVELFVRAADASAIALALSAFRDPDDLVRARLIEYLASPHLRDEALDERCTALETEAAEGVSDDLRLAAVRGLARIDAQEAKTTLAQLLVRTRGAVQAAAAEALASGSASAEPALAWIRRAALEQQRGADAALLARLVSRHLPALLSASAAGAETVGDRSLFALLARHPDARVAAAVLPAVVDCAELCAQAGDAPRAQHILSGALGIGLDDRELLRNWARVALQCGDAAAARGAAEALARASALSGDSESRADRGVAHLLVGASLVATQRFAEAEAALVAAENVFASLSTEGASARMTDAGGGEVDVLAFRTLVSLHRVVAGLAAGRTADDTRLLEWAREADLRLLHIQLALSRRSYLDSGERSASFDDLLHHELGPATLYFGARASNGAARERWIELEAALLQSLANVTRGLIPGFVGSEVFDERLGDPLADDERREALEQLRQARTRAVNEALGRRVNELERQVQERDADPSELIQMLTWQRVLRDRQRDELEKPIDSLLRLREFSRAGLALVERLRENGRSAAARRLAEQVVKDFESLRGVLDDGQFELALSRAESALGGVLMDQDEPVAAEQVLQRSLERLRALDQRLAADGREAGREGLRSAIAGVLVSLAVNANVKLGDVARALEYFERAYELDQSDFMRILLACYRARAGRVDEARAILRSTPILPSNFYNAACTHALLGESATALDYLQRDFDELRTSAGARARQKEWARKDPDLAALRGDPRFERLLAPEPAEANNGEQR